MIAELTQRRPDDLREVLDFEETYGATEVTTCAPVLAQYDRIIEDDRQYPAYETMSLSVLDKPRH